MYHRIRRVKCDEGKPSCKRCKAFGTICDGYQPTREKKTKVAPKPIQPRGHPPIKLLVAPIGRRPFDNDTEEKYFWAFQTEIGTELSGTFDTPLWNHLILQASDEEPFVRMTVIALSAMNMSQKTTRRGPLDEAYYALADQHHDFSLKQYDKALQQMRSSLAKDSSNPRKILISCLLVCCFESLSGNPFIALSHAKSGQRILQEWLDTHPHPKRHKAGITSPQCRVIEDSLIQAASFFELQILGYFDSRPVEVHRILKNEGSESVDKMPEAFSDIDEARLYWNLIQRRSTHFMCEISASAKKTGRGCAVEACGDEFMRSSDPDLPIQLGPTFGQRAEIEKLDTTKSEQRKYAEEHERWTAAFADLYWKIQRSSNARLVTGAHMLAALCKSSQIALVGALDTDNCSFDDHLPEFQELVSISRLIIDAKKGFSQSEFSFELGIIPGLHMVAKWCRDRTIRRQAIALLRRYDFREGVWDSLMMAEMDTRMMRLEEDGIETDHIPEHARVKFTNLAVNIVTKSAVIEYVRGSKKTGELKQETSFSWAIPETRGLGR